MCFAHRAAHLGNAIVCPVNAVIDPLEIVNRR
jgi:hypothetical protein